MRHDDGKAPCVQRVIT